MREIKCHLCKANTKKKKLTIANRRLKERKCLTMCPMCYEMVRLDLDKREQ